MSLSTFFDCLAVPASGEIKMHIYRLIF